MAKIRLAVLTGSLSRSAGGLFWSVRSLCKAMHRDEVDTEVFGAFDKHLEMDLDAWGDIPLHASRVFGPASFLYRMDMVKKVENFHPDVVHTHGIWTYASIVASRLSKKGIPTVVSIRGMLDKWAVRNAGWKKSLASFLYEAQHLKGASCLHALNDEEYHAIRAYGLRNPIAVIPNGVALPSLGNKTPPAWRTSLPSDAKIMLFLGRIHPKKGLEVLLKAWAVGRRSVPLPWHLVIGGWDQDYLHTLKKLAGELKILDSVHFVGPLFENEKDASFRAANAFILPSFSEGLPMAILEAWAYQLPVLMTKECNLPIGFERNAAIQIEPAIAELAESLSTFFNIPDEKIMEIGTRGLVLATEKFGWAQVGEDMLSVYKWLLGQASTPTFVRLD